MSTKEDLNKKLQALMEQEEKIKLQLDHDSEELKAKALRVGKIALVAGLVSLVGYGMYRMFFDDDENETNDPPREEIKKHRRSSGFSGRIMALATPYLIAFFEKILQDADEKKDA